MKNYYALIHFCGTYVHGFLLIGQKDSESARLSVIKDLTKKINEHKKKAESMSDKAYVERDIERLKDFRKSFTKPHRKTKKGDPVLEMLELPESVILSSGYWLGYETGGREDHLCNLPRQRTEHPKGYVISTLD